MIDNKRAYNTKSIVDWYNDFVGLMPVEKIIFDRLNIVLKGSKVLDIGIGAGRTTSELYKVCKEYTGIDFSENLIKTARLKFPQLELTCMNAADLSLFSDGQFDFVNFSFNGIDYSDMNERIKILNEISRVIKPEGYFFFSTHNRNAYNFNKSPWFNSRNSLWINIKTFLKLIPFQLKHFSVKRKELVNKEFAIINNCAHNYSLMTFHSTPKFVIKQLEQSNFTTIEMFDKNGCQIDENTGEEWIFVLCKKTSD